MLGNYSCDSYFRNFSAPSSDVPLTQNCKIIFQEEVSMTVGETLFYQESVLEIIELIGDNEESDIKEEYDKFRPQFWTLYFEGSKLQEGSGAGCILIDLKGKRHFLSCRLEFECTKTPLSMKL
jgi:hypothetical protein